VIRLPIGGVRGADVGGRIIGEPVQRASVRHDCVDVGVAVDRDPEGEAAVGVAGVRCARWPGSSDERGYSQRARETDGDRQLLLHPSSLSGGRSRYRPEVVGR
jgi:hypothetical protein